MGCHCLLRRERKFSQILSYSPLVNASLRAKASASVPLKDRLRTLKLEQMSVPPNKIIYSHQSETLHLVVLFFLFISLIFPFCCVYWASLIAQSIKNLPVMQETQVQFLGQEDSLEKEMTTHSSILAWEISWREEPGGLQSKGSQKKSDTTLRLNNKCLGSTQTS